MFQLPIQKISISNLHSNAELNRNGYNLGGYSAARRRVARFVDKSEFRFSIGVVIAVNTAFVVYEVNHSAKCDVLPPPSWCDSVDPTTEITNMIFLSIYFIELLLKSYAFRWEILRCNQDTFDVGIVIISIIAELLSSFSVPSLGILRLGRLMRVVRALRLTSMFNEISVFMSGMASAFRAIVFGAMLIALFVFFFAVVGVVLLNPVNQEIINDTYANEAYEGCHRCAIAYESVQEAMLTLLQTVVMQDNWGTYAVPLIQRQPLFTCFFIACSLSITLGLVNLILSVIVDKALKGFNEDLEKQATAHRAEVEHATIEMRELCRLMDVDQDGQLSMEEFLQGFENARFKALCTLMDIARDDLPTLFQLTDNDNSGRISYREFADQIIRMVTVRSQDMRTTLMCVNKQFLEVRNLVLQEQSKTSALHRRQVELYKMIQKMQVGSTGMHANSSTTVWGSERSCESIETNEDATKKNTMVKDPMAEQDCKDMAKPVVKASMPGFNDTLDREMRMLRQHIDIHLTVCQEKLRKIVWTPQDECDLQEGQRKDGHLHAALGAGVLTDDYTVRTNGVEWRSESFQFDGHEPLELMMGTAPTLAPVNEALWGNACSR